MLAWACVLGILGLSATASRSGQFSYGKGLYRRSGDCQLCYDNDCLTLDEARCDYFVEADSMLPKDDDDSGETSNPTMKKNVDSLIYDLVDKATGLSNNMECIPYLSRYTNCNKENVCIGCKSCTCDVEGKWNCSTPQLCHTQDPALNIDHRVLVMVMETLIEGRSRKVKRSVTDSQSELAPDASTITLEQMSEWLYGVKPLSQQEFRPTETTVTDSTVDDKTNTINAEITTTETEPNTEMPVLTTKQVVTDAANIADTDYVAFDEVLRSIAVDTKSYSRRKLPMDNVMNNKTFDVDYMLMDDDNITSDTAKDDYAYIVNFMREEDGATEIPVEGATKVVIDLLKTVGQAVGNFTPQDYEFFNKDDDTNKDEDANAFENTNDIIEYNAANIMKRDVSAQNTTTLAPNAVPILTVIVNTTNTSNTNNTDITLDLKDSVLTPLNKIISDKINELQDLKRIRINLARYLQTEGEPEDVRKSNNDSDNKYFSIYNLAMETGLGVDLRRANPSGYDKYMLKLKSDIYEVIRDVMGIQKHKRSDIPDDLKLLMHAMKRYVYKNKVSDGKQKKIKSKKVKSVRRQMEQNFGRCDFISFKDCVVQILEVIDKDMPKSNALSPLSPAARKIMKHVVKSSYIDDYAVPGLRVHDPHYNLTNDLQDIGSKWQEMTAQIISSSPFVTLYRMKLLHYVLTVDVSKMNDALALIDFAHSRRMLHTLDNISDDIIDKINAGLTAIHNKIQIIIRYYSKNPKPTGTFNPRAEGETTVNPIQEALETRNKKKRSFIKHIRSLLKTSKKDIAELLHRKVPKSEIVKQLAKKKLDEISEKRYSEYEETMKRWQNNLAVTPRIKRSVLETFKTRIKNIIPQYLRHKVNPRIKENKKNSTATATRRADDRKQKRIAMNRERKARRSTTPPNKKSSVALTPKVTKTTTVKARPSTTTKKQNVATKKH